MNDYPLPFPSRKDLPVSFAAPKAVGENAGRKGKVVDVVSVGPVRDDDWGWYLYFSELIKWDHERENSIRLSYYYYAPFGSKKWLWVGSTRLKNRPSLSKSR